MKLMLLLTLAWCIIVPGYSVNYPIIGAKRHHRASVSSSVPYYNQYYEHHVPQHQHHQQQQQQQLQPQYVHQSHPHQLQSEAAAQHLLLQQQQGQSAPPATYEDGYLTSNGYYYYPSHEYHTYGLPTYHGEYKPKPFYYAPRPSYSYYDDHEVASNPLDDLQEEILQEDERDRQSELLPYVNDEPADDDSWYDEPQHMPTTNEQQDILTNNFLRNLMEYNRQMEENQRLQQLEVAPMQKAHPIEYDDYSEINPDDYQFQPEGEVDRFDMQKYRNEMAQLAMTETTMATPSTDPKKLPQQEKFNEIDDEDVRQLKSLATKHQRERQPLQQTVDARENHHEKFFQRKNTKNWNQPPQSVTNNAQYDDPADNNEQSSLEYDDDSWINWDRKRSGKRSQERPTTNTESGMRHMIPISTTATPTLRKTQNNGGQKEVVLPRPATPQRHLFGKPAMELIHNKFENDNNENSLSAPSSYSATVASYALPNIKVTQEGKHFPSTDTQKTKATVNSSNNHSRNDYDGDGESSKRSKVKTKPESIYDTIKQLIAMEQQLEENNAKSKITKRYVSNEESLVDQLNNLKRLAD